MTLASFDQAAGSDAVAAALKRDGAVVLRGQASERLADAVARELRPSFDSDGRRFENDFNGYKTLRVASILALSRSAAELIGDPRVLEIIDQILLPHCINYRIGSMRSY